MKKTHYILRVKLTDHPVVSLAIGSTLARHLNEAVVEAEIMSYRVLPAFLVVPEVRISRLYEVVDFAQRHAIVLAGQNRLVDESDVTDVRFPVG